MNLDILISAANWLYENSPAKYITEAKNAVLVYGDGDLADSLFDLLFTTAFMQDMTIELVRVCTDAEDKGGVFINRNPDGLEFFARMPVSDDDLRRPLAIHFIEADAASEWNSFSYAYAIAPKELKLASNPKEFFYMSDIPILKSTGDTWSRADEIGVPVLRIARKVHTAYTLGWNDRYREEDIDRDLYGALANDVPDDYMLRSSLRLAVSVPWKMAIAGAESAETLLLKISSKNNTVGDYTLRDYLAWQEHRSWQAFMTLDGWSAPTPDDLQGYLFKNGNDHRNKKNIDKDGKRRPLHPCLCDLIENDWFSGKRSLKDIVPSEWSKIISSDALQDFTLMDQFSLRIHHRCKEIVLQKNYRNEIRTSFDALERALIKCHPVRIDVHFDNLRLIEKMFDRLLNNEANSYHPYELACHRFMRDLEQDNANGAVSVDIAPIVKAFDGVQKRALVAIERNKYCDYREIDSNIIDWLPWIIADTDVETIWKLYSEINDFTNLMSSIILRPRNLILVCQDKISDKNLETYRAILGQYGLTDISVSVVYASDIENGVLPIDETRLDRTVVDVSEVSDDLEYSIVVPQGVKIVFFSRGKLRDRIGAPGCAKYFPQQINLGIDEVLQIKGKTVLTLEESNDLLGMEEDYIGLWKLCTEMKSGGAWHGIIEKLQDAEKAIRLPIYRNKGREDRERSYSLPEGAYERLIRNGGLRTLYDLQKRGAVSHMLIDVEQNKLALKLFPHEIDGRMDYSDSEATLDKIIIGSSSQSQFAIDTGYLAKNAALGVYDLNSHITIDNISKTQLDALNKLVGNGYIRRQANPNEYTYKSKAVRHALAEEGFALEAYVYYTLFLSGCFDDVRGNVRIATQQIDYNTLEKELDVLVIKNGVIGIISCKDTHKVKKEHIKELSEQAKMYGIKAKPILVCANYKVENKQAKDAQEKKPTVRALSPAIVEQCELRGVTPIGYDDALDPENREKSRNCLVDSVIRAIQ